MMVAVKKNEKSLAYAVRKMGYLHRFTSISRNSAFSSEDLLYNQAVAA